MARRVAVSRMTMVLVKELGVLDPKAAKRRLASAGSQEEALSFALGRA